MASKYLLMIHNSDCTTTLRKLIDKGFSEEYNGYLECYARGTIPLTIAEHTFVYNRCHDKDGKSLRRMAYTSTNIFSEAVNVSCLKTVLGDDIQFTLYKDVTDQRNMPASALLPM